MRLLKATKRALLFAVLCTVAVYLSGQHPASSGDHLTGAFSPGWMLIDTNGDGLVDAVAGKIVVPDHSSATENAAAADLAARVGYATTGLTPSIVIDAAADKSNGPRIWVGQAAVPARYTAQLTDMAARLAAEEGAVFVLDGNLAVIGKDDVGLLAAAEAFASRMPYLWK